MRRRLGRVGGRSAFRYDGLMGVLYRCGGLGWEIEAHGFS